MPRYTTLSASATSAATAIGVTADIFRVGDIVRISTTGEAVEITTTAAGAVTATRALGRVAAASAASTAELFIVGNANVEANTLREIRFPQLVTASNYCQIIRTPFGLSETEKATEHYAGDEEARLQSDAGVEHARAWEQTFFFGARDLKSTNRRMCGGLYEFITTNVTAVGGALSEGTFLTFLKAGFRYGSDRKVLFASPIVVNAIENFARGYNQTSSISGSYRIPVSDDGKIGVSAREYVCGQGTVDIVMKRTWNDSAVYGGYAFLVDMDNVKKRPLRATKLKLNVQAPDYDGIKSEYITEESLQVIHERTHSYATGITS